MSKEVKAALKAAREAIRNKEYKEAIKHCKIIFKQDKSNYNALVFVGVAAEGLDQPEQAVAAYKKAIEADEAQPLAWQGLCGFYEKSGKEEYKKDLLEAYIKLSGILKEDVARRYEIQIKLAQLYSDRADLDLAVSTFTETLGMVGDDAEKSIQIWKHLIYILSEQKELVEEHTVLLEKAYDNVLSGTHAAAPDSATLWISYIKFLFKQRASREKISQKCVFVAENFPEETLPLEYLCQIDLDKYAETKDRSAIDDLMGHSKALEQLSPDTVFISLAQACDHLLKVEYRQAADLLVAGTKQDRHLLAGWVLLTVVQDCLHDNTGVLSSISRALKLLADPQSRWTGDTHLIERNLTELQAKAQVELGSPAGITKAVETLSRLLSEGPNPGLSLWLGYAYLGQGNIVQASQVLSNMERGGQTHQSKVLQGWLHYKKGEYKEAQKSLESVKEQTGRLLYQKGLVYQALSLQDNSFRDKYFTAFIQSAKLDPYFAPTFYNLGKYYQEVTKDNTRARRCYQKAYDLNPDYEEAGGALVDILVAQGEEENAIVLLRGVTKKASAGSAKWAWLRLGLAQLKMDDHTAAIMSLQAALRADPKDSHAWECLGEAYLSRGSYTAALKAFVRATEINPEATYCFYQLATIQQMLGAYPEAVRQYEGILEKSADYVPALKGVGETNLLQAKAALASFSHGRAVDHCQTAIHHLTRAASQRSDMSCLWKLLGDACTLLHPVGEETIRLTVPSKLLVPQQQENTPMPVNKGQLLALGVRCYGMALKQVPECASLWHDLGVGYFFQSRSLKGSEAKAMVAKATQCIQKAVTLDTSDHRHWLALGVVATCDEMENAALAQHCFIKSIKAEANNVAAWTYLGALYLKDKQIELAHEAFKMAQSLEPSYVGSWVGQALIAETVGHDDAMDLFRHTTDLSNQTESALGYASWVINMLANKAKTSPELFTYTIEQMAAVPAAADVMARYTDRVKTNPLAYNLHGLLLEKLGLKLQAADAFKKSVELLEDGPPDQARHARSNLARLLGATGRHQEAVEMYEKCSEPHTFEETCGLALAFYKAGQYDMSMKAYERALAAAAPGKEDASHLQAALGLVAFQAGHVDTAKTLLFKCSQVSPPSASGLQALCALGLLEGDTTLAAAVLQELGKLGHLEEHATTTLYLTAELLAAEGQVTRGRVHLQRELHLRPHNGLYWQTLANYLLHYSPGDAQMAATCGQAAQRLLASSDRDLSSVQSVAALASGLHARRHGLNNAFRFVQKAVHLHPALVGNWCSLLGAVHAEQVVRAALGEGGATLEHTAMALAAHLMAKVESELSQGEGDRRELAALHLWTVKQYVVTLLSLGRSTQAQQFLQQAVWLYDSDPVLKSLTASLEQNFRGMRLAVNEQPHTPFLWQLLVEGLKGQGLFNEVDKTLRQWLQASRSRPAKLVPLVQLTHLAYSQIIAGKKEDKWRSLLEEASTEALSIEPNCPAVHLMVGAVQLLDKHNRQAKHSFEEALAGGRAGGLPAAHTAARQHLLQHWLQKGDAERAQPL